MSTWTPEAVEVVTAAIRQHTDRLVPAGGDHGALLSCSCGGLDIELTQPDLAPARAVYRRHRAEAVLAALAEGGLLVPAGGHTCSICCCICAPIHRDGDPICQYRPAVPNA